MPLGELEERQRTTSSVFPLLTCRWQCWELSSRNLATSGAFWTGQLLHHT